MCACPHIHTHIFHLHHFYTFLPTLPTPLKSQGFSFPPTSTGEVYPRFLKEGFIGPTVDLIVQHKVLCKKWKLQFFPPGYSVNRGKVFSLAAVILNWQWNAKKIRMKNLKIAINTLQCLPFIVKSDPTFESELGYMSCFGQWDISKCHAKSEQKSACTWRLALLCCTWN